MAYKMTPDIPEWIMHDTLIDIYPSKTYKFDPKTKRIIGYVDGIDAMKQAVYLHTSTELHDYEVFPRDDYGIEVNDLYGKDMEYVAVVLEKRIREAISVDTRVIAMRDYKAIIDGPNLVCYMTIESTEGTYTQDLEFNFES